MRKELERRKIRNTSDRDEFNRHDSEKKNNVDEDDEEPSIAMTRSDTGTVAAPLQQQPLSSAKSQIGQQNHTYSFLPSYICTVRSDWPSEISLTRRSLMRLAVDLQDDGIGAQSRIPFAGRQLWAPTWPGLPRQLHHTSHHCSAQKNA